MSPKNQICSYGAHFATVAEKRKSIVQLPVQAMCEVESLHIWKFGALFLFNR